MTAAQGDGAGLRGRAPGRPAARRGLLGRVSRPAPPAVLALVPVLAAFLSGVLRVEGCVPASGAAGWAGVHLALVHPAASCPAGTAAVGGTSGQVLAVVVTLAAPALAAHATALAVVVGATGVLRTVRATLAALAGRRMPTDLADLPAVRRLPLPGREPVRPWLSWLRGDLDRRGPPAPAAA